VTEARGQFRNPEESEHLPLKAVAKGLVKTQLPEKTACFSELQSVWNSDNARVNCSHEL
jgi:hypothetical protein